MNRLLHAARRATSVLTCAVAAASAAPAFAQAADIGPSAAWIPKAVVNNSQMHTQMLIVAAGAGRDVFQSAWAAMTSPQGIFWSAKPGPCQDEAQAFLEFWKPDIRSRQLAVAVLLRGAISPAEAQRLCSLGNGVLNSYPKWSSLANVAQLIQQKAKPDSRANLAARISLVAAKATEYSLAQSRIEAIARSGCRTFECMSEVTGLRWTMTGMNEAAFRAAQEADAIARNMKASHFAAY